MKHSQDNTPSQTALLRGDTSVDTPVKNSLCCAAAGITALPSSTTEVPTPHEKLREAATLDATLIAQDRPPAQPVVGEKALLARGQPHRSQLPCRDRNNLRVSREYVSTSHRIFYTVFGEQSRKDNTLLKSPPYNQERLDHFGQRKVNRINPLQGHQLLLHGSYYFSFESHIPRLDIVKTIEQTTTGTCGTLGNTTYKFKNNLMPCPSSRRRIASLLITDVKSSDDSGYTSKCLKPCSRILPQVKRIKHDKKRPSQSTDGQKDPNHPYACNFQIRQNVAPHTRPWPPAIGFFAEHAQFWGCRPRECDMTSSPSNELMEAA
jgi:hypothetical protein